MYHCDRVVLMITVNYNNITNDYKWNQGACIACIVLDAWQNRKYIDHFIPIRIHAESNFDVYPKNEIKKAHAKYIIISIKK